MDSGVGKEYKYDEYLTTFKYCIYFGHYLHSCHKREVNRRRNTAIDLLFFRLEKKFNTISFYGSVSRNAKHSSDYFSPSQTNNLKGKNNLKTEVEISSFLFFSKYALTSFKENRTLSP